MTGRRHSFPEIPTLLVALLLAGPVLAGLAGTVLPAFGYLPVLGYDRISLEPFRELLAAPGLARSALLSFGTGLVASLLSLAIVLVFAAGWAGTATFQRLSRFLSPLLSVPHAAAAIGLAFLIAPSGFLVRALSPWATGWTRPPDLLILNDPLGLSLTFGLVAKEVPFLFLMTLAALSRPHIRDFYRAGASLGYGRMATFFKIVLPQIYPLIRLPVLAVIAYATSVVDVAVILGPTTPAPLAPRLVGWMSDPDLSRRLTASAGALLQLGVTSAALLVYLILERLALSGLRGRLASGHRHRHDGAARHAGLALMVAVITVMMLSLLLLGLWSMARSWWFPALLPQRWDLMRLADTFTMGAPALWATLALAVTTAGLATALTLWLLDARSHNNRPSGRRLKALVFLPLLLPQIGFLFGLQMLFLLAGMSGSFPAVLLAQLVFVFPYAVLSLSDSWARLDPRYTKAAASIGASRARIFWQVRLPLLLRPVLTTLAVAAAVSVGQYLPTLMIGAGRIVTVTTESVALASGGNRPVAALYALLQLLIPLTGFVLAALIPAVLYRNRAAMRLERG
ncbi:ABC transporter permease [Roseibium sediminicola]|uniref:ABC transporter permease subunit n=1 Tax=Roseibium sediminicola TaxID=2933272 RepID=A0ABT0GXD9_9HYPH|nr:ABC transporter permease subunit [Roseibium sp. CAU 1639]MCK7614104.1 ABC transporter permease subunit [Roseibium sp. CAU 1639]